MKRLLSCLVISCLFLATFPASANAASTNTKRGLLISPLRSYITINAGEEKTSNFTIANLTDKSITVTLSVKQFSVSDYAYNYSFTAPNNSWLIILKPVVNLRPGESQTVPYHLNIPQGTAPGGNYYTLFASANLASAGLEGVVQAATLLYITVNGTLIRTSTYIGSTVPRFLFSKQLAYTFDVKNTGNVHYFAYFSGTLTGLFRHPDPTGMSHLLLPSSIRHVSGTIPAPILPGVYRATYSYITDAGTNVTRQRLVVFIPPWSVALTILVLFGATKFYTHQHKKVKASVASEPTQT
jgi:hypothetical protein